jgi:hypothetical protein
MNINKMMFCALALGLSGCASFEIPDTIVSKTIETGKSVYLDITNPDSNNQNSSSSLEAKGVIFSSKYTGELNISEVDLKDNCLRKAEDKAKEKLKISDIAYRVISEELSNNDNSQVATCKIAIL